MSEAYSIRNLTFSYPSPKHRVLDSVSLELAEGEVLSILGRNGAGKSTLLSCMLGLSRPQTGEVFLMGKALRAMRARELAALVGYVPQNHAPVFGHTVFDFVQMGCAARVGLLSQPGKREREDTAVAIEALGITHLAARPYTALSGGERQQAVIARAIVNRPRVVLFDEPTAHLDLGNQLRVLRIIRRFADAGLAVVITTHNPDHALLLGGRTAILDGEGRLRSGKTEELVTADALRSVYGEAFTVEYLAELGRKVCVLPGLQL